MAETQHLERHALEGVALANDRDRFGEMIEVGSLSGSLSTAGQDGAGKNASGTARKRTQDDRSEFGVCEPRVSP